MDSRLAGMLEASTDSRRGQALPLQLEISPVKRASVRMAPEEISEVLHTLCDRSYFLVRWFAESERLFTVSCGQPCDAQKTK